jgi:hypothetical protein
MSELRCSKLNGDWDFLSTCAMVATTPTNGWRRTDRLGRGSTIDIREYL